MLMGLGIALFFLAAFGGASASSFTKPRLTTKVGSFSYCLSGLVSSWFVVSGPLPRQLTVAPEEEYPPSLGRPT